LFLERAVFKEHKAFKVEQVCRVLVDYKALLVQELRALLVLKEPQEQVHRASKDAKAQQVLEPRVYKELKVFRAAV
jgi:hypothetical protein